MCQIEYGRRHIRAEKEVQNYLNYVYFVQMGSISYQLCALVLLLNIASGQVITDLVSYTLMKSSLWLDTIYFDWSVVCIEESHVLITKRKNLSENHFGFANSLHT